MYQVIIVGHVLVGLAVIGLILIQHGKGADAGAAFGSGSSGSVFGAQGSASFLSRTTAVLAAVFFSTSLGLAVLSGNVGSDTDIMDIPVAEQAQMEVPTIEGDQPVVPVPVAKGEELPQVTDEEVVIEDEQLVIEVPAATVEDGLPQVAGEEVVIENEQSVVEVPATVEEGLPQILDEEVVTP